MMGDWALMADWAPMLIEARESKRGYILVET